VSLYIFIFLGFQYIFQNWAALHRIGHLGRIHEPVPSQIYRDSLAIHQICDNLGLIFLHQLIQLLEAFSVRLELFRPVQSQVKRTATIIELLDFATWALVVVQQLAYGRSQCLAQQQSLGVVVGVADMVERLDDGQVLTQAIPS